MDGVKIPTCACSRLSLISYSKITVYKVMTFNSAPKLLIPPEDRGPVCACAHTQAHLGKAEFLCMYIYNCCSKTVKTVAHVRGIRSSLIYFSTSDFNHILTSFCVMSKEQHATSLAKLINSVKALKPCFPTNGRYMAKQ